MLVSLLYVHTICLFFQLFVFFHTVCFVFVYVFFCISFIVLLNMGTSLDGLIALACSAVANKIISLSLSLSLEVMSATRVKHDCR